MKIRVLVIGCSRLNSEGITACLNAQPDINAVSAVVPDIRSLKKSVGCKVQVVLLDSRSSHEDCIQTIRTIRVVLPMAQVVLTNLDHRNSRVLEFIKAGVSGFVDKSASVEETLISIRSVAGGKRVLPAPLTAALFSAVAERHLTNPELARLSIREREVAIEIAKGLSNKQIAAEMQLTTNTVKSHVHAILEKLALNTRLEIAQLVLGANRAKRPTKAILSRRRRPSQTD